MVAVAKTDPDSSLPPKSKLHPVAAIMPGVPNPTAYHAANVTTVLEGSDDSDDEVSNCNSDFVGAFIESVESPANTVSLPETPKELAPLMVPHLFWRASVSPPESLPYSFDCLLDNGSHIVLIRDSLVNELGLRKKRLKTPIETDVAMNVSENEKSVTLHEFVKLSLYDTSGEYRAKTVRAIVALNLCCPVLLGLPFLSHNNIVVDHAKRTAIDKYQDFDLLNPSIRSSQHPKKNLKPLYSEIMTVRKAVAKDLKVTCKKNPPFYL